MGVSKAPRFEIESIQYSIKLTASHYTILICKSQPGRHMNSVKVAIWIAALAVFLSVAGTAGAQEPKKTTHRKVRTLTGCLHKDGDDYSLTTRTGGTWELKSDAVKLAPHVGHTI